MSNTYVIGCPSCSAEIILKYRKSNLVVCKSCFSVVEILDEHYPRTRAELTTVYPADGPLHLGDRGTYQGESFQLIGRVISYFQESEASNWSLLFADGELRTLMEFNHEYVFTESFIPALKQPFSTLRGMEPGAGHVNVDGVQYYLDQRNACQTISIEGEVLSDETTPCHSVELVDISGNRIEVVALPNNVEKYYRYQYVERSQLSVEDRGQLEIKVQKKVKCVDCANTIELYALPYVRSFSCNKCLSQFLIDNQKVSFVNRQTSSINPHLPLHSVATIEGINYKLVGFVVKQDEEDFEWREYSLYNPLSGFIFLTEFSGHWVLLKRTAQSPVLPKMDKKAFVHNGEDYFLFNKYKFRIRYSEGEFPGNIFNDRKVWCSEYISPPEIWVREKHSDGMVWYKGTHFNAKQLSASIPDAQLPPQEGLGAVQPVKFYTSPYKLISTAVAGTAILFMLFLITQTYNRQQVIIDNTYNLNDSAVTSTFVTEKFHLDKWRSNLKVDLAAAVNNDWFELSLALINADNGSEFNVEQGVEYYQGYEEGSHWSEGSTNSDLIIPEVPAGNYFLQIHANKNNYSPVKEFYLKITYDVPVWRNLVMTILIFLVPIAALYFYVTSKESERWQNSSFTPDTSDL